MGLAQRFLACRSLSNAGRIYPCEHQRKPGWQHLEGIMNTDPGQKSAAADFDVEFYKLHRA